jgi:hypothetical protein
MPTLINRQTQVAENVPAEVAAESFLTGTHNLPMGGRVALNDPTGEPINVDASEVYEAIKNGYSFASDEQIKDEAMQAKYGEGVGNAARAFGEAAASAASFGAYDVLAPKTGLTTEEAIRETRERSPISSGLGSATGVLATLAIPGSPVARVAKVGQAVEKGVASAIGQTASKVLARGVPAAAGSAVEGLVYGAGQAVSESALGDQDLISEKTAAQIGMSGLLGGAIGGALGLGAGALGGVLPKGAKAKAAARAEQEAATAGIQTPTNPASLINSIDEMNVTENARKGIVEGLSQRKANADDIIKAAEDIGAPVMEGQISASKHVQDMENLLQNSPTPIGVARKQMAADGYAAAERAVVNSFGDPVEQSLAQVGDSVKGTLKSKIESQYEPIEALYKQVSAIGQAVPVNKAGLAELKTGLNELKSTAGLEESYLIRRMSKTLEEAQSVEQLRAFKTSMNNNKNPTTKFMRGRIAELIDNLEENSILTAAKKASVDDALVKKYFDAHTQARAGYRAFKQDLEELGAVLGKKRIYGKQDFLDFIDDLEPEKLTDKLFAKKNSNFLKFFKEKFPEEMQQVLSYQKSKLLNASMKDGVVNVNSVMRNLDKLEPEVKSMMFTPAELSKIKSAKTYMESLPGPINPSGTSKSEAYRRFLSNPISAATETARDLGVQAVLTRAINIADPATARGVQTLIGLERLANKTSKAITAGTKAVFSNTGSAYLGSQLAKPEKKKRSDRVSFDEDGEDVERTYKVRADRVAKFVADPAGAIDRMEQATASIYPTAPGVTGSMYNTATRAMTFLDSKIPRSPVPTKPLSPQWIPSKAEIGVFNRYYDVVEDPLVVLQQVKEGTLTSESLEALTTVYPKLYQSMREEFVERITETNGKIPYQTKMMLSMFLGEDLDDSTTSESIAANQMAYAAKPDQPQPGQAVNPTVGGAKNLDSAGRALTPMQKTAMRGA